MNCRQIWEDRKNVELITAHRDQPQNTWQTVSVVYKQSLLTANDSTLKDKDFALKVTKVQSQGQASKFKNFARDQDFTLKVKDSTPLHSQGQGLDHQGKGKDLSLKANMLPCCNLLHKVTNTVTFDGSRYYSNTMTGAILPVP